jgi:isoquinoline 1-oxidoreductase
MNEPIELERYELFEAPHYQFALARRDFFKVVGGGIAICLLWDDEADAQQQGRRRGRGSSSGPPELEAWLHIDEQGSVTVFTGKAEVGQNIRTSLAQAVADELGMKVDAIKLVMADTERVPPDAGTFGSRTTPSMAPQLRRAAASARGLLVDMAAERLGVEASALVVADGKVTHAASGKLLGFGELTHGQKLTRTIRADASITKPQQWQAAGKSAAKVDGRAMVTGQHQYASDVRLPGMLFGKVLRAPKLNSTLVSADLLAAQQLAGVIAVRDGDFVGVAAPTQHQAEQAIDSIRAQWQSPEQISHRELFDELKRGDDRGRRAEPRSAALAKALDDADHKIEATYTIAYIAHAPLEPRAAVAHWEGDKVTIWTGTQRPFGIRSDVARAFGMPQEKVRVIVPDTGSAYGGKHTNDAATEAARLAKAAGKPVKLVWTREEEFTWAYFRPAGVIEVAAGVSQDGRITAWDFHNYNSGGSAIRPLYDIGQQRSEFHGARAPLRQGSYRALAATANHFARESHIDDLAAAVGVDPLAFRLKNTSDARLRAVLEAAAGEFGWSRGTPKDVRGRGIAGGSEKGSYVACCAEVEVDPVKQSVRVLRVVTAFECGAIVNPRQLENQVEGAVVMGLGGALFEAIEFDDGRITNARFSDYRVPRFRDMPKLKTVLVNRPDLPSAGAGETPIVAIAPAIGNAIFQATGHRLRSMPMTPGGKYA